MLSVIRAFRQGSLSEGDWLVEMKCAIIMVLAMLGYLRLALVGPDDLEFQKKMILIPLGAITAWGVIDGIMYVLLNLVQRGRQARLLSTIKSNKDQKTTRILIEDNLSSSVIDALSKEEREKIYDEIIKSANNIVVKKPQWVTKKDLLVIFFTFVVVFSTGSVLVIPFLVLNDPVLSIRVADLVGIIMLFFIGYWWGKVASRNKIRSAIGITLLGVGIVVITILLGG